MIDITNQTFGFLTAMYPCRVNDRLGWHCKCICGKEIEVDSNNLRHGKVKSCGCKKNELIAKKVTKNLTGRVIGQLTVLGPTDQRKNGSIVWKCQCECGNICFIPTSNLSRNHTTSCGCTRYKKVGEKLKLKLLGQQFGLLTVIEELPTINNESRWKCYCACGNTIEAIGWHLTKGIVKSCGCLRSKGEQKIFDLLSEYNIPFVQQQTFMDCMSESGNLLKFDFYVNDKYLIEFDGEQHFLDKPKGYYTLEKIQKIKQHDTIKNQWCIDHNIPLIRIKYDQYDTLTIKDLLLKE